MSKSLYSKLLDAVGLDSPWASIKFGTTYEPAGGPGSKVFPPTFPKDRDDPTPYVIEERLVDGVKRADVLLDSVQSQANRVEEALTSAAQRGDIKIPMLRVEHNGATQVSLTSLEMPHRYADAYLRDSELDGVAFDKTELGAAFQQATLADASVLLQHDPGSLVFGAWNSHRKGRQAKFPRVYQSELIGWDPVVGRRKAGRMDPLNLQGVAKPDSDGWMFAAVGEKVKGEKLSEIGHGNIAPNDAHGGVTISAAERVGWLSFGALQRVSFGPRDSAATQAGRALLAAYALMADRLAFGSASLWLRSGCDLRVMSDTTTWTGRDGDEPFQLTVGDAIALYDEAVERCTAADLPLELEPVVLHPNKSLASAIDFALTKAESSGE